MVLNIEIGHKKLAVETRLAPSLPLEKIGKKIESGEALAFSLCSVINRITYLGWKLRLPFLTGKIGAQQGKQVCLWVATNLY